jgi:hypothetical protein
MGGEKSLKCLSANRIAAIFLEGESWAVQLGWGSVIGGIVTGVTV